MKDTCTPRMLHLGAFLLGAAKTMCHWTHPMALPDAGINFSFNLDLARKAEEAKFDFVFVADTLYADSWTIPYMRNHFEPLTLLSALSSKTSKIGLVGTLSSTYSEPFNAARQFLSLDHLSAGRAAWNVVTSIQGRAALNFSRRSVPSRQERYDRADEFVDVVKRLWCSWGEGAFVHDKETGVFVDESKVRSIKYNGNFLSVKGALNISRSPQGIPVVFHAGISPESKNLAAKHADVIFVRNKTLEQAQTFYESVNELLPLYGRKKGELLVMQAASVLVVDDECEMCLCWKEMQDLENVESTVKYLSGFLGYDLSSQPLDSPLERKCLEGDNVSNYIVSNFLSNVFANGLTLRQIVESVSTPSPDFYGTPEVVADGLQMWFEQHAADGFILSESLPGSLVRFMDSVVPILQSRGLFRFQYKDDNLRGHLDLLV
ncbi:NtaA/DmoA family FMN-dependent monooxygenase [Pseudomonas aeruginosa]|uniref:NtaA/DmoA family FMN-dependent monooxygenase n=1 Tax=Pseudomonas aeruginosa TaxID=287 RepID=UPI00404697F5